MIRSKMSISLLTRSSFFYLQIPFASHNTMQCSISWLAFGAFYSFPVVVYFFWGGECSWQDQQLTPPPLVGWSLAPHLPHLQVAGSFIPLGDGYRLPLHPLLPGIMAASAASHPPRHHGGFRCVCSFPASWWLPQYISSLLLSLPPWPIGSLLLLAIREMALMKNPHGVPINKIILDTAGSKEGVKLFSSKLPWFTFNKACLTSESIISKLGLQGR